MLQLCFRHLKFKINRFAYAKNERILCKTLTAPNTVRHSYNLLRVYSIILIKEPYVRVKTFRLFYF